MIEFRMPSLGADMDAGTLVEWLKKPGDPVKRGDIIACLDVFDPEPIPVDHVVRGLPNVFLTPHIAGVTAASEPRFFDYMVDEVLRALDGYRPSHELIPRESGNGG